MREPTRGHTLPEIIISASLLLMVLGMVVVPFTLIQNNMKYGQSDIDTQSGLRVPISRLVRELAVGYTVSVTAPATSGASNSITGYIYAADGTYEDVTYSVDTSGNLIRTALNASTGFNVAGSPKTVSSGLSYLSFQPEYEDPSNPGSWLSYTLPLTPTYNSTSTYLSNYLDSSSQYHTTRSTVILVDVIAYNLTTDPTKKSPIEMPTSFTLRN